MNDMAKMLLVVVAAASATLPAARVDMRGTAGYYIATGVEVVGTADGGEPTAWDTTLEPDGWIALTSGGGSAGTPRPTVDVLVLNGPLVVGGRMSQSEAWDDERVVVVRDDVVVPAGKTLTLGLGTVIKFTEGARIVVEDGGAVVAEGAYLAAFDDDSVGGDTDMNGAAARPEAAPYQGWLDDPAVAALSTVKFVDGATNLPTRTYTAGTVYGTLPELARDDAMFGGWFMESGGEGSVADAQERVPPGETILYSHWIPYEMSIYPESADVECLVSEGAFTVAANDVWEANCDADWVELSVDGSNVVYSVEENASTDARVATIRLVTAHGLSRDFTIRQAAMEQLDAPTINPADGTTFIGSSRRVSISGAESGAEIRYTLDGSEPTATSKLYTKSFNVFDTTVVKARVFKSGKLASATVSSRIVRLQTLAEALDVPLWTVTTSGDAGWIVENDTGRGGASCARSGMIGDDQQSMLSTTVEGAGTLTFWWKVDCEDDDIPDDTQWDYLMFEVDGAVIASIDGDSGWRQVHVTIKSEGTHTLTWTYSKDYMDDDMTGIEDCGWVDQLTWTPLVDEVPVVWLENLGMVSAGMSAADAANADPDGDGVTTAHEYVMGTDPNDPDSKLTASIEMVDGQPVVTYTPDLLGERVYRKLGKKRLDDPNEEWVEVQDGEEGNYNFFKVTVELP